MNADFFPSACCTVDAASNHPLDNRRAQQQVVDTNTGIPAKGIPEILSRRCKTEPRVQYSPARLVNNLGPGAGLPRWVDKGSR
jgi:hypothetical protein